MRLVLLFLVLVISTSLGFAQSITLISPNAPQTLTEGDDFATQVLQNPWDMDQRRDIGWEEAYVGSSVQASNGIWSGVNETSAAYVFPLFGGFAGDGKIESPAGDLEVPRLGINNKISTSTYTHMSMKYKHTDPNYITAYWKNDEEGMRWPLGENFANFPPKSQNLSNVWHVRTMSLAGGDGLSWSDDPQLRAGSWTSDVMTLRIDPSFDDQPGDLTEIDWIRVFDPQPEHDITFSWNYNSIAADTFMIMADNDASGFDGYPIFLTETISGTGTTNQVFNLGALPPGTYYFYVETAGSGVRSGYSPAIVIDDSPTGYFIAPSEISGTEYAATEVNNVWDMNDATDVPNLIETLWPQDWRQFIFPSFANGLFSATAEPAYEGRTESDAQVHLYVNSASPIDTRLYRYLTYTMQIDDEGFTHISDKVKRGWVARAAWWDRSFAADHGSSRFHVVYEGMKTYTIDLWDADMRRFGRQWIENPEIRNLRIDPLETDQLTRFFIDNAVLTAEPRASSGGTYTLSWNVSDNTGGSVTVDLYWDSDDQGFDGTLISSQVVSAGTQEFTWDTSGLDNNPKYVYAIVTDSAGNTNMFYARARVQLGEYTTPVNIEVPFDYDGDGASDEIVYRNQIGTFFTNMSNQGPTATAFGGAPFVPIDGDFDGDGRSDFSVYVSFNGFRQWFSVKSTDNLLQGVSWGLEGDQMIVGDFNGDNRDDYGVYRNGVWFLFDLDGTVSILAWGAPTDIPVPADYDGDGKDDVAIWRPATGNWWILNSGFAQGFASEPFSVKQWGLPGDIPAPFDMDVDGKADFVVWREASGHWFINNTQDDSVEVYQWGLPGDIPQVGDYNGDGMADLTVFRPGIAYWFHNFRTGQSEAVQWGLPTDLKVE